MMKTFVIDFKFISHKNDMWEIIRTSLGLPNWFGKNLDALWDVLTGYIDIPCKIFLLSCDTVPADKLKEIVDVIIEAREQYRGIDFELHQ